MAILPFTFVKRGHGSFKIRHEYRLPLCTIGREVRSVFNIILDEWQLTKDVILAIEKHDGFLDESPSLKASLDFRLPYFNVLNYIQIELIKRLRNNDLTDDEISLIHITINGIATGLRNSG